MGGNGLDGGGLAGPWVAVEEDTQLLSEVEGAEDRVGVGEEAELAESEQERTYL